MRNLYLLFLFIVFLPDKSLCQYNIPQNKVWAFGRYAGLDFNSGNPTPLHTKISLNNCSASIAGGTNNQLMFYSDGHKVWDAQHNIMPHSYNLAPGLSVSTQGVLIVPLPGSTTKYLLFYHRAGVSGYLMYYNTVNMNLNNGLGDLDSTENAGGILVDDNLNEKMTTVAGCNNNVWVLVRPLDTPSCIRAYEVTATGVNPVPVVSNVPLYPNYGGITMVFGVMKISPSRTKLVECGNRLLCYDFNPVTGVVSNQIQFDAGYNYYGASFSPNGSKLYTSDDLADSGKIYQFDMNASYPPYTKTLVGYGGRTLQELKLAPDGKIYFGSRQDYNETAEPFGAKRMGRINNPDNVGAACNFQEGISNLYFPDTTFARAGLPNDIWLPVMPGNHIIQVSDTLICNYGSVILGAHNLTAFNYHWENGMTSATRPVTQAGTYWVSYTDGVCNSYVDTYKVKGAPLPTPTVTQDNNLLTTQNIYSTYQWYLNGNLLPGAITNMFTLQSSDIGWASVKVGNNSGCYDSIGYLIMRVSGIDSVNQVIGHIACYPNPAGNLVAIKSPIPVSVTLYSIEGKWLKQSQQEKKMDLSGLPSGIYLLKIEDRKGNFLKMAKVVKQ